MRVGYIYKANFECSLAWAEMRIILAHILWCFDIELQPESLGWIDRQKVFFLWEKPDLKLRISCRK
ncbi:hypothetical protein GQ53DRAFT_662042 [Thozetella sp. PMI_491]|nr:hypothetical protein GQ53DRAFT_662042 [Thozetella sp. PMI_491]